ncbi:MAG: NAD(P)H-dependent oxidoreductase [Pseudomonadota bacterium]
MSAKIFSWVGHPAKTSVSHMLADAYERGAREQGADIRRMNMSEMNFDPNLADGYNTIQPLENDLEIWQDNIVWADHVAWFYPMWWGGMPAKMKGALDRALLPGFGFKYHENDPFWDRLLKGRSGDVFMTADTPNWFDWITSASPARRQVKKKVLEFVGIKPVETHYFAAVRNAKEDNLRKWQRRAHRVGADAGRR